MLTVKTSIKVPFGNANIAIQKAKYILTAVVNSNLPINRFLEKLIC